MKANNDRTTWKLPNYLSFPASFTKMQTGFGEKLKIMHSIVYVAQSGSLSPTVVNFTATTIKVLQDINKIFSGVTKAISLAKLKEYKITKIVIDISSLVRVPISMINLTEKIQPLPHIHEIFKKVPVLGVSKFAGIPHIALMSLNTASLIESYQKYVSIKKQNVEVDKEIEDQKKTIAKDNKKEQISDLREKNKTPSVGNKNINPQISDFTLEIAYQIKVENARSNLDTNRVNKGTINKNLFSSKLDVAHKTFKVSSSVLFLGSDLVGGLSSAVTAVKVSLIAADFLMLLRKKIS